MSSAGAIRRHGIALAAALLLVVSLGLRWPGVAMYDSVGQYEQALSGDYADWHPPIMARTWSLLIHVWPGTAPFFLLQMALWWGGLALLAVALARGGRGRAAIAVLAIGAFPLFLGWTTVVLKDAQMAACLVAGVGLCGWFRLRERSVPVWAAMIVALLLAYATLVRGNAAFATVPLGLALVGWFGLGRWWLRAGLALIGIVAVLGIGPILNHRVMQAEATHNDRSLPLWDIAAIAHRARLDHPPRLSSADWAMAEQRGCYTPYFWNPYGEDRQCGFVGDALAFDPGAERGLMRDWIGLVLRHPLAYAAHRLAHLNASLRFLVAMGEPDAIPPVGSEPNAFGLGRPANPGGRALIALAKATNSTPLGWPVCWLTAGGCLLWALARSVGAEAAFARALAISALVMSGSFAVASIACDLRYHLWSMVAVALALVIGWHACDPRRRRTGAAITIALAVIAFAAHLVAPPVHVPLPPPLPAGPH